MSKRRLYRDLGVLAAFLLAFYAAVLLAGRLGVNDDTEVMASQRTYARVRADQALRQADYDSAVANLQELIEFDPLNSHAHFLLTTQYHNRYLALYEAVHRGRQFTTFEGRTAEALKADLAQTQQLAETGWQTCQKSYRYRRRSLIELAELYALVGDKPKTLATLKDLIRRGYTTDHGIYRSQQFEFLADSPEFQRLARKEFETSKKKRGR